MNAMEVNEKVQRQVERACICIRQHAAAIAAAAGDYKSSFYIRIEINPDAPEAKINYDLDAWGIPDPPPITDLFKELGFEKEAGK